MAKRKTWALASFAIALLIGGGSARAQNPDSRAPHPPARSPAHVAPQRAAPPAVHVPAKTPAPPNGRAPAGSHGDANAPHSPVAAAADAALIRATWARMLVTAMRSVSDLQSFTARQLAAQREDPGAVALRTSVAVQPPADDGPHLEFHGIRGTVLHVEPPTHAGSDGHGERADLPALAVSFPP